MQFWRSGAIAGAAVLAGCSTTPRDFTPTLAAAPAQEAAFENDLASCRQQVAAGRRADFANGRATTAGVGTAVGVGAGLAAGASAASGAGMLAGTAGAMGLAAGFVVFAPLAMYGAARTIRARKERDIRTATATCLQEHGYTVAEWEKTPKAPAAVAP